MKSISQAAIRNIREFWLQGLAMTAWSFEKLTFRDAPLLDALAEAALASREFSGMAAVRDGDEIHIAHALMSTFWKSSDMNRALGIVRQWMSQGFVPDPCGLALLWMNCEWHCDSNWQRILDPIMAEQDEVAIEGPALRGTHAEEAASGVVGVLRPAGSTRWRYHKLSWLIDDIESHLGELGFSAFTVLHTIENFGRVGNIQWLKIAGDDKAYIIESGVMQRLLDRREVFFEFGCYVGYSAIRLGQLQFRVGRKTPSVFSMERDAVHAAVARHLLNLSRLRCAAEVRCGLVPLVTPRMAEEVGCRGLGFLFMDHRGTRFDQDMHHIEGLGLFGRQGRVTADNSLLPGAPYFCWVLRHARPAETIAWSLSEFDRPGEDWMVVHDRHSSQA